ncbi:hypothetical protein C8R46DRAFT_1121660 [Mycena filopes]|nr:hypothetical protein C8R46DRAFT_1121660 [Mycena filopes]
MHSGVRTTMRPNTVANAASRQDYTLPPSQPFSTPWAVYPSAQPIPHLSHRPRPPPAFSPALRWERAPRKRAEPSPPSLPRRQPIALPPQVPGVTGVTLNPALRVGGTINVDFSTALECSQRSGLRGLLTETATFPGLPSLSLIAPQLPWVITAHAETETGCVVVEDVLRAIRQALDMRIDEDLFNEVIRARDDSSRKWAGDLRRKEGGRTRVDLLQGRTRFGGLSESTMGCDVWMVTFL